MIVGIPKERKSQEYRVGMLPSGVVQLKARGHEVLVEEGAGRGAGFADEEFRSAGAEVVETAAEVWERANLIIKATEPVEEEYPYFRKNLILFSFLHLARVPVLAKALELSKITAIAYETIQREDGSLPCLKPTSEIAGRMATQKGAFLLEKPNGGRGIILGGVPGTKRGQVTILGGGVAGLNAAKMAVGAGASVCLMDTSLDRLEQLDNIFGGQLLTLYSDPNNIAEMVSKSDLLIGAVLIPGARAPKLVTADMVRWMKPGSVIVDVSVDQGGCVETTRETTHDDPWYEVDGVIHYGVTNMAGSVPRTSTFALCNATTRYVLELAGKGLETAVYDNHALYMGINTFDGHVTYEAVAEACDMEYKPLSVLL